MTDEKKWQPDTSAIMEKLIRRRIGQFKGHKTGRASFAHPPATERVRGGRYEC